MFCNEVCVDPTSDRLNCGTCGFACGDNARCVSSECKPCPSGQIACGTSGASFCTDITSDDKNCGTCSLACAHGLQCSSSVCTCALNLCGADCVDTQTDVAHCGACDTPCPSPGTNEAETCIGGHCAQQCVAPHADCDGVGTNGCEANLQTDSANCAACTRSCNSGSCISGMCPLVSYATGTSLSGVAVDASFVYWSMSGTGGVVAKAAIGTTTTQVVQGDTGARLVAVDATRIVWFHGPETIESLPIGGGSVTPITIASYGVMLTLSGGYAYYTQDDGHIFRVPSDGSLPPTMLSSLGSVATPILAVDATNVYFVPALGGIGYVPIGASNASTTPFANVTDAPNATSIALDGTNVYWTDIAGTISSQPKSGGPAKVLASGLYSPVALATDSINLYVYDGYGNIRRLSTKGGPTIVIATSQGQPPAALAVDTTNVYWTSTTHVGSTPK